MHQEQQAGAPGQVWGQLGQAGGGIGWKCVNRTKSWVVDKGSQLPLLPQFFPDPDSARGQSPGGWG